MEFINKFKQGFKNYPNKKPYLEFFTALLTIPVLLTVVAVNYNNLKGGNNNNPKQASTIVVTQPPIANNEPSEREVVVTKDACKEGLGDIAILSPEENEEVSGNPVFVDVSYDDREHCQAVWSYRINGGAWSSYDDRSIALYGLSQGNIKFDLRVKSVVNSDQKTITRNFIYSGSGSAEVSPIIFPSE